MRVAVVSDVHGNVAALRAVLADVAAADVDLLVVNGDITWGPEPAAVARRLRDLDADVRLIRGNADRALLELAAGVQPADGDRERWMLAHHPDDVVEWLGTSVFSLALDVDGLGPVRFCHGTPRADTELVTPGTPLARLTEVAATMAEPTLVSGHTHLQFDRPTDVLRSVNPGSVGLPYHDGPPGTAFWALLGPDVSLRRAAYDLDEAVDRFRASGIPNLERYLALLTTPPSVAEIVADAESRVFAD